MGTAGAMAAIAQGEFVPLVDLTGQNEALLRADIPDITIDQRVHGRTQCLPANGVQTEKSSIF